MKVNFHTFGCKVNTYDTGLLQKNLQDLNSFEKQIMVVNTCAVTGEATQESIRWIRKYKLENPSHYVVVTGCSAQVDTEFFIQDPNIDLLVANSHKGELKNLLVQLVSGELKEKVFKSNIFKKMDLESEGGEEDNHTRSFLKIQDGCNSFCTFCVIPFARGKSRSIPSHEIIEKINYLYEQGKNEVVITGVHIGDYEDKIVKNLEGLIVKILKETAIPRIRISSLEPIELTEKLLELFNNPRMCKHFHLSIQSANSRILNLMKRKYTSFEVEKVFTNINKSFPNAYVGMDVIVGFPGETEEEYFDTYQRLDNSAWTRIHVFPYSKRPGTFADRLSDQLPRGEITSRARRLRELSSQRSFLKAKDQIGKIKEVLLLQTGKRGLCRDYWTVDLPEKIGKMFTVGSEIPIQITGVKEVNNPGLEPKLVGKLYNS